MGTARALIPKIVVGKLLYYACAVDSTLNVALSSLASEQNSPTTATHRKIHQLLDYCATLPNARLTYKASDMQLQTHSDAGYKNVSKARSCSGGHFYLGSHDPMQSSNGAILNSTNILKHVASSAADCEIGAAFTYCKDAIPVRTTLIELGFPQQATHVCLDNTTALGFIHEVDMRYYWLRDLEAQH